MSVCLRSHLQYLHYKAFSGIRSKTIAWQGEVSNIISLKLLSLASAFVGNLILIKEKGKKKCSKGQNYSRKKILKDFLESMKNE